MNQKLQNQITNSGYYYDLAAKLKEALGLLEDKKDKKLDDWGQPIILETYTKGIRHYGQIALNTKNISDFFRRIRERLDTATLISRKTALKSYKELELLKQARFEERDRVYKRNNLLIEFLFYTGIRVSEITNIKHQDYQNQVLRILGKGNKIRIIDQIIQKRAQLSGINKHITPHTFRRSFATLLYNRGGKLTTVQKLLGHSHITTTAQYIHNDYETLFADYSPRYFFTFVFSHEELKLIAEALETIQFLEIIFKARKERRENHEISDKSGAFLSNQRRRGLTVKKLLSGRNEKQALEALPDKVKYQTDQELESELPEQGYNYGIRTVNRYIQTANGIHVYCLIKELPPNSILTNQLGKRIGELHSLGKQVVGIGSIHQSGVRYSLKERRAKKTKEFRQSFAKLHLYLPTVEKLKNKNKEKAKSIEFFMNRLIVFEITYQLGDKEIEEILKFFESLEENISFFANAGEIDPIFLYEIAEIFFSRPSSPPLYLPSPLIIELPSGEVKALVKDIFWTVPDSIANRIRYKL
ncbi:9145_t:CDS:10 [Entrophospora sp. SA101]|nr:9145_t:CDS:10 [Entrophospora sp. SA101]